MTFVELIDDDDEEREDEAVNELTPVKFEPISGGMIDGCCCCLADDIGFIANDGGEVAADVIGKLETIIWLHVGHLSVTWLICCCCCCCCIEIRLAAEECSWFNSGTGNELLFIKLVLLCVEVAGGLVDDGLLLFTD